MAYGAPARPAAARPALDAARLTRLQLAGLDEELTLSDEQAEAILPVLERQAERLGDVRAVLQGDDTRRRDRRRAALRARRYQALGEENRTILRERR